MLDGQMIQNEGVDMASRPVDIEAIDRYTSELISAQTKDELANVKARMLGDDRVSTRELLKIAKAYAGRARRITSRKAALEAIERRFVDRVRSAKKLELARSSRPW